MAEKRSPTVSDDSSTKTVVNFGAFPFPLTDGPDESPYLKWVRNHSNYMAVRGFLDYLRIVAVLVRGIVVNFLIFLPYLLIAAVGYGYAHHWMLEHPFYLTLAVLAIVIAWILFFPTLMKLIGVISYRRSLEVGSESSIKQRDVYERSFGGLLMVILAVALLESLPWILEYLHDLVQEEKIGWKGGLATVAAALALLSGSDKLLSALSGAKKKVAMVLIGILGLLVPLLVILYATDFLVYGPPPSPALMFSPLAVPVLGVLAIAIAIPLGLSCRAFTTKECAGLLGLLLAGLVLVWGVVKGADSATDQRKVAYEDVRQITAPIAQVAAAIGKISNKTEMIPEVATLVDEIAAAEREYAIMKDDVKRDVEQLRTDNIRPRGETWSDSLQRLYDVWNAYTKPAAWEAGYFLAGQQFVTLGDELSAQPRGSLEPLRRELAKLAYGRLLQEHREKADSLLQEHREKADSLLQEHRERVDSEQMAVELLRNKLVELVGLPEISVYEDFVAETSNEPEEEKDDRRRESVKELQRRSVEELAILAGENQLADMVDEKFKKLPGKAELARLA